ncbi:hypothetical protein BV22DRAFT_1048920 [Leucogyrophana mollusca]|uniref:Uncharacterized protein n=1 Tax=Leucogyrophana mollusca TaxID=85980 RepID=A0ACB8B9B5_9AGAM|nr:hypothetical protein BV22DRAFT_1048920 [Leucogyrophana mollusca]
MPGAVSQARKSSIMGVPAPNKLYPVDLATYKDDLEHASYYTDNLPDDVDEPWPYRFEVGEFVWVRTVGGNWHQGKVSGQPKLGRTRENDGLFYPVIFSFKIRKYFAPLNGELKPDSPHTRKLLEEAGWI